MARSSHRTIVTGTLFSFLGGLHINENGHVVALDASTSVDPQGFRQNFLRDWNATAPPYEPAFWCEAVSWLRGSVLIVAEH